MTKQAHSDEDEQDKRKRSRRADRLKEYVVKADEALAAENYAEALGQLKEAYRVDSNATGLRERIAFVEDKKRRHENAAAALVPRPM